MSTIRVPPYRADPRTAHAGFPHFADNPRFVAAWRPQKSFERRFGILRRHYRQELTFVGNVQRIQSQQLACATHRVAHRNPIFQ